MKNKKILVKGKMYEVNIHYKRPLFDEMPTIKCSMDANNIFRQFGNENTLDLKEYFWVMLLNNSNCVLGISEIGKGDATGVCVNVKEIFQLALMTNSSAIILCHNHPSGKLKYSSRDKLMTNRIDEIGKLFSIQLLDHLIITSEGFYSFSDDNQIIISKDTLPN